MGYSSPLRGMQGHQHDLIVVVELIGVGDERDLFHELVDDRELASRADEFAEVLDPGVRLDRVLRFELGQVAGAFERELEDVAGSVRRVSRDGVQAIEQFDELGDPPQCLPGDTCLFATPQSFDEGHPCAARERVELVDARIADPAFGRVENALERHLVGGVHDGAQVGHRVLDLTAVVETGSADDLVWHTDTHERLFEHAALRVGAIEDRHVAPGGSVRLVRLAGT